MSESSNDESLNSEEWSGRKALEVGIRVVNKGILDKVSITAAQASEIVAALSEKPSINPVGLVKMIRDQRDEIWNAALEYLAASDSANLDRFNSAEAALREACAKVPSYSQRLDNIFKGIADVE